MARRRCSLSVDLDAIGCYYRIHGLGVPPESLSHLVLERCLPRFLEVLDRRGIRGTFFVVAGDVDREAWGPKVADSARKIVGDLAENGHEIGNHSYSHSYAFARWGREEVRRELESSGRVLQELGAELRGFRAPGYDLSGAIAAELVAAGYAYDSSIFPAPGYYAAKLAVLAGMRLLGRESGAVLTNPRALLAPTEPYRADLQRPWRRGQSELVELPIAVTPGLRIPAIGTALLTLPEPFSRRILGAVSRREFLNFELHGIDLCDADADGIPDELRARQPDLRLPLSSKLARFEAILDRLGGDFDFAPLFEVAASY